MEVEGRGIIFNKTAKKKASVNKDRKQRLKGDEGGNHVNIWRKTLPEKGERKCKGPDRQVQGPASKLTWLRQGRRGR